MPFGVVGRPGPGMRQVVGYGNCPMQKGNFGGERGASHCNQWGLCGVVVQKCMNRPSCHLGW